MGVAARFPGDTLEPVLISGGNSAPFFWLGPWESFAMGFVMGFAIGFSMGFSMCIVDVCKKICRNFRVTNHVYEQWL